MSWTILTIAIVMLCFLCAFGFSEWLIRRSGDTSDNDGDSSFG